MSAPVKLKNAARLIAWRGVRTLVETTVAIAFAASWKPLMYSKARAASTTRRKRSIRSRRRASGVLQHDLEDDVARITAAIDHLLEQLVDVAQEDDLLGVVIPVIQVAQEVELQLVSVAFDALE